MSTAIINKPDGITCTLQFTMKLEEWKRVRKTLQTNRGWDEIQIINEIDDLVNKLEKTLYAEVEK